jgi:uncharacterized protein (DUF2267 family)
MIVLASIAQKREMIPDAAGSLNCLNDPDKAERVLRAILHKVRDILQLEEAIVLLRLLPLSLKQVYIEDWCIRENPSPISTLLQFVEGIRSDAGKIAYYDFPSEDYTAHAVKVVLEYIENELPDGKGRILRSILPTFLWPLLAVEALQVNPFQRIYTWNEAI